MLRHQHVCEQLWKDWTLKLSQPPRKYLKYGRTVFHSMEEPATKFVEGVRMPTTRLPLQCWERDLACQWLQAVSQLALGVKTPPQGQSHWYRFLQAVHRSVSRQRCVNIVKCAGSGWVRLAPFLSKGEDKIPTYTSHSVQKGQEEEKGSRGAGYCPWNPHWTLHLRAEGKT